MVKAAGYVNGDDCFLVWSSPPIKNCLGFAIWRDRTTVEGQGYAEYIHNWVGFEKDNTGPRQHKPSDKWPFQRFTWTDHSVGEGDTVTYSIIPVIKKSSGLEPDESRGVKVGPLLITSAATRSHHAFFNRGILLSQFIAGQLPKDFTNSDLSKLKAQLAKADEKLRVYLMGQLGARLAELLDEAKANKWHVYGALYELSDDRLIDRLIALGKRAHIILSNGSEKKKGTDGNAKAAKALDGKIDLFRRMLWSEGLGHNKFLVIARSASDPIAVWTGSTNWATTGLCTQMNNAILIEAPTLARTYLDQWKRLRADHRTGAQGQDMHFGTVLMASNDKAKKGGSSRNGWTVWFTRTDNGQDIDAASDFINSAQHSILFLMFEPGSAGLLQVVQARLSPASRTYKEDLYVHGVVNTLKNEGKDVAVDLVARGQNKPFDLNVVEPEGIKAGLANWADEVTRADFITGQGGVIGHAIIHSKVIVLDPFTDPVVITGSHNFSHSASASNDENLIILRGNSELAQRYAVNIMSTYQHYRWRAYLQECKAKHRSPWHHLVNSDTWQGRSPEQQAELDFWLQA